MTLAILALCMVPIAVAVIVGVVRKADSDDQSRPDATAEASDATAGGSDRGDALLALGVVGVLVIGCVATPFVLARRDRDRQPPTVEDNTANAVPSSE